MATVAAKTTYTPEDLLAMPDGKGYELVDGNLVELHVSVLSSLVGGRLFRRVADFTEQHDLGWVWPSCNGLQCFPDAPAKVRRSDLTFVRKDRLTPEMLHAGFLRIPPDLVAEVLSPNDSAYEVDEKLEEYLRAGVRLVWIINPETHTVRIHRADGSIGWLRENDELDGEDVLPGFCCLVRELFPPVPLARQAATSEAK